MSLQATLSRVADLQAQLGLVGVPAAGSGAATPATVAPSGVPGPNGISFASVLGQLSGSAGATAAATAGATAAPAAAETTAYDGLIAAAAQRYGVDPSLVRAVIKNESGFDPGATSAAGAQGLMQLMPGTAAGLGVTDAYDPAQSIDAGTRYLKAQLDRFSGDARLAVAAYNAGPSAVDKAGGVPPYAETQAYVQRVLADQAAYAAATTAPAATGASTTGRTPW